MLSFTQVVFITTSSLESILPSDQAQHLSAIYRLSSDNEPIHSFIGLSKRRIDSNSRVALPLFRGSNLGIFVRKRPSDHSMRRRIETRSQSDDSTTFGDEIDHFNDVYLENQRRHEYDDSAGPMFG
ncbi:unnamed protein product [Didymodactylos carnosus]|uniref:Uncharacterized protein n=1 Tax=Didymodactylos carnosus TaxID=1234261 RepID=A0A813TRI9_9BILA|nr:unnamed protein product [Didymodactylos carnosus]CAF0815424.1 unnamed protein product [Didymodactylos carnosus]CAF3501259.1 unnamed protein product [Didymodactylos carnosus]CAF3601478.1 unnamed protein product [Didymodactylos carnosus]